MGRANPHLVEAMQHRTETLNVHSRYLHEGILDYAERLTSLHADPITTAVFTCNGTEANEVAIQMARAATGGRDLMALRRLITGTRLRCATHPVARTQISRDSVDSGATTFPADRRNP